MASTWRISRLVLLCFLLTGCSYEVLHYSAKSNKTYSSNSARVSSVPHSGYHRVQVGETLYSIAFRYGLDYKALARKNGISAPYLIFPQQKIRLTTSQKTVEKASSKPTNRRGTSASDVVLITPKSSAKKAIKTQTKTSKKDTKRVEAVKGWSWPIEGSVTRGFSNAGVSSKGIDIKGKQGDAVKAAANGTVVYAGNGLIGYGNLVIVKHNDIYLSAYAYNERILVKEQQNVRAGDSLAIIGGKGDERPLLHFEVRRDGQPIDPLNILPKK